MNQLLNVSTHPIVSAFQKSIVRPLRSKNTRMCGVYIGDVQKHLERQESSFKAVLKRFEASLYIPAVGIYTVG